MRACEGCRRRKIKCDAATTNSWPCAACVRLKLTCVPPTVNYNRNNMGVPQASGLERVLDFADTSDSGDESFMPRPLTHVYSNPDLLTSHPGYTSGMMSFGPTSYPDKPDPNQIAFETATSVPLPASPYGPPPSYRHELPSNAPVADNKPTDSWQTEEVSVATIQDALGELKIDANGIGRSFEHDDSTNANLNSSIHRSTEENASRGSGSGGRDRIFLPNCPNRTRRNG